MSKETAEELKQENKEKLEKINNKFSKIDTSEMEVKPEDYSKIKLKYHGELMEDWVEKAPVENIKKFKIVKNSNKNYIVFSINENDKMLILQGKCSSLKEDNMNFWEEINFMQGLFEGHNITSVEVLENIAEKSFDLAVGSQKDSQSYFSLLKNISINNNINWNEILKNDSPWSRIAINTKDIIINNIFLGKKLAIVSLASKDLDASYSIIDLEKTNDNIYNFELPENSQEVIKIDIGKYKNNEGIFLLHKVGEFNELQFGIFDKNKKNVFYQNRISAGDDDNIVDFYIVPQGNNKNDNIYLSTIFTPEDGGKKQGVIYKKELAGKTKISSLADTTFNKLDIAEGLDYTSIWAIAHNNVKQKKELISISDQFYNGQKYEKKWRAPIVIKDAVKNYMSLRGNGFRNKLFFVTSTNQLGFIYQDDNTTEWKEEKVFVYKESIKTRMVGYNTNVTFGLTNGLIKSFQGLKVQISSTANTYATINGEEYLIGPHNKITHEIEGEPKINIVNYLCEAKYDEKTIKNKTIDLANEYQNESLASPRFIIEADFLKEAILVDPTDKLTKTLLDIGNADSFKQKTLSNGQPLWAKGEEPGNEDLESAISIFKKTALIKEDINNSFANKGSNYKVGDAWGVDLAKGNKVQVMSNAEIEHLLNSEKIPMTHSMFGDTISFVGCAVGDIIQFIKNTSEKIGKFVYKKLQEGWKLVLEIGGKIVNFVVKCTETLWSVIKDVFNIIKLGFQKLIQWLSYLFDWEDIMRTKELVKGMINSSIDMVTDNLETIATKIDQKLVELESRFLNEPLNYTGPKVSYKELQEKYIADAQKRDPRADWIANQLRNSAKKDSNSFIGKATSGIKNSLADLLESEDPRTQEIVKDLLKIVDIVGDAGSNIKAAFNGEIDFMTFLTRIGNDLARIAIRLTKALFDIFMKALISAISLIQEGLNQEIELPFISWLYTKITGDKLSVINAVSLIIAIPSTIVFKLLSNHSISDYVVKKDIETSLNKIPEMVFNDQNFQGLVTHAQEVTILKKFKKCLIVFFKLVISACEMTILALRAVAATSPEPNDSEGVRKILSTASLLIFSAVANIRLIEHTEFQSKAGYAEAAFWIMLVIGFIIAIMNLKSGPIADLYGLHLTFLLSVITFCIFIANIFIVNTTSSIIFALVSYFSMMINTVVAYLKNLLIETPWGFIAFSCNLAAWGLLTLLAPFV